MHANILKQLQTYLLAKAYRCLLVSCDVPLLHCGHIKPLYELVN